MHGWSGERIGLPVEIPDRWKRYMAECFPALEEGVSFEFTSRVDFNYNCLSWALGCDTVPFWKDKGGLWIWPDIADDTVEGWIQVCELHGFCQVQDPNFVVGFEKIAILKNNDGELHACRSDRNGKWKSKLGVWGPDIDHDGLAGLEQSYGSVVKVLQKHRPDWLR